MNHDIDTAPQPSCFADPNSASLGNSASRGESEGPIENVLAPISAAMWRKRQEDQGDAVDVGGGEERSGTIIVKSRRTPHPPTPPPTRSARKPSRAKSAKAKRPVRRGPRGSTCLSTATIKALDEAAYRAARAGKPLNCMATIRTPIDASDSDGKRSLSRHIAHIGEALKRRGRSHLGLTVYEKERDGYLHAHHLFHVAPKDRDLIAKWTFRHGEEIVFTKADRGAIPYVTKQRRWGHPDYEATIKRPWRRSEFIVGVRCSITTALRQLVGSP